MQVAGQRLEFACRGWAWACSLAASRDLPPICHPLLTSLALSSAPGQALSAQGEVAACPPPLAVLRLRPTGPRWHLLRAGSSRCRFPPCGAGLVGPSLPESVAEASTLPHT